MKGTRGAPARLSGQTPYSFTEVHKNLYGWSRGGSRTEQGAVATQ